MLRWIWEHIFWPPRGNGSGISRRRQLEELLDLRSRVGALEVDLAKLRGRVVGGLRGDVEDELEDPPEFELDDAIDESRSLGARRRFGKE